MINEKEIESITLSACRKDFYQIWNELLETAGKLSNRWSPESTNESDPGIVLLKVLAAIADKLNYTIDKNTLECFMPSAAQEESMRKLCDMMGYNMKYYQSATTDVTISFIGKDDKGNSTLTGTTQILIPKYTNLKNTDDDVNYFTTKDLILDEINCSKSVQCMEGEVCLCGDDTDNIISINQIDDNYRYYLPESQIAENGIFITNIVDETENTELWEKVDNLNVQPVKSRCFKFGFDSRKMMPYIQFPDDIAAIIEDGLVIRYTRTNGINGNISYGILSKLEEPEIWSNADESLSSILVADNFTVKNPSAALNGKDKETIDEAYNAYKKVIGTFDTLVTCRDYMNKIYQMTTDDADQTPLVSNVIVSDIRDDINRAVTLCTFSDYGIAYVDKSLVNTSTKKDKIEHFDLVLYPFNEITDFTSDTAYMKSFKFSTVNSDLIEANLEKNKTISHNICYPEQLEIACIKNYLKLQAKITTTSKVNIIEEKVILNNIYNAIYKAFNMRNVDFGEEIPFDTILSTIKNADTRIKNVALEEPELYTKCCLANGTECDFTTGIATGAVGEITSPGFYYYNQLALRNILAGRISIFDYDTRFKADYTDARYPVTGYEPIYGPTKLDSKDIFIGKIESEFNLQAENEEFGTDSYTLGPNEVIQFRCPNFITSKTYPAYINYYLHLKETTGDTNAVPATFDILRNYLDGTSAFSGEGKKWESLANSDNIKNNMSSKKYSGEETERETAAMADRNKYGNIFTKDSNNHYTIFSGTPDTTTDYYYLVFSDITYGKIYSWVRDQVAKYDDEESKETPKAKAKLKGIFRSLGGDQSRQIGEMVDSNHIKYAYAYTYSSSSSPLDNYYIQITHNSDDPKNTYTKEGLGRDANYQGIKSGEDYKLDTNEWLAINYTPSSDDDSTTQDPVNIVYTSGTVIRPNFDLISSEKYKAAGHTPTKKSGYNFDYGYKQVIDNIGGMYTLGTNEQIELREAAVVELKNEYAYIYWERNDESEHTSTDGTTKSVTFTFDEDNGTAYTLKEGEYFYYTDINKQDLAYYGNGTKIIKTGTITITKEISEQTSLADEIANKGLLAAIPWKKYILTMTNCLTLKEYQYITLIEGDTLNVISNDPNSTKIEMSLSKNWTTGIVKIAKYTFNGEDTKTTLPKFRGEDVDGWRARSILNINTSPTAVQTLRTTGTKINDVEIIKTQNSITVHYYKYKDDGTETEVYPEGTEEEPKKLLVLTPKWNSTKYEDLSIKTNYIEQTSKGYQDVHKYTYDTDGNIDETVNDFSIKVLKDVDVNTAETTSSSGEAIQFGNYGDGDNWTKISFAKPKIDGLPYFELNTNIPTNDNGLLMIYNIDPKKNDNTGATGDEFKQHAYIRFTVPAESTEKPQIFNATSNTVTGTFFEDYWWKNGTANNKAYGAVENDKCTYSTEDDFKAAIALGKVLYTREEKDILAPETGVGELKRLSEHSGKYYLYENKTIWATSTTIYYTLSYKGINKDTVTNYYLRTGLNIVRIPQTCTKVSFYADNEGEEKGPEASIVISNLSLCHMTPTNNDAEPDFNNFIINPRLCYNDLTTAHDKPMAQLLEDILKVDVKDTFDDSYNFYYNAVIDNSLAIDLNTNLDAEEENLANPKVWYDYNNINNKFVTSEIDTEVMKKGITLTNSSRR